LGLAIEAAGTAGGSYPASLSGTGSVVVDGTTINFSDADTTFGTTAYAVTGNTFEFSLTNPDGTGAEVVYNWD